MIYIDIASKFSFHPRYRIFPGQPFSPSRSLSLLSLYVVYSPFSLTVTPARDPLYQTKQSRTRSEDDGPLRATVRWQFIYPEHLYNNLLTRYVFLARETTFFTALYLSAACYRERIALLCDLETVREFTLEYGTENSDLRYYLFLGTSLLCALKIRYNLLRANSIISLLLNFSIKLDTNNTFFRKNDRKI